MLLCDIQIYLKVTQVVAIFPATASSSLLAGIITKMESTLLTLTIQRSYLFVTLVKDLHTYRTPNSSRRSFPGPERRCPSFTLNGLDVPFDLTSPGLFTPSCSHREDDTRWLHIDARFFGSLMSVWETHSHPPMKWTTNSRDRLRALQWVAERFVECTTIWYHGKGGRTAVSEASGR